MTSTLAQRLVARLASEGNISQAELARRAGVPREVVNRLLKGRTNTPTPLYRRRLATYLGISNVQFLVEAGDLTVDEVDPALLGPLPFAEGSLRSEAVKILRRLGDDEMPRAVAILEALAKDFRNLPDVTQPGPADEAKSGSGLPSWHRRGG